MAKFNLICKSGKCEGHVFISYKETLDIITKLQQVSISGMISATELKTKLKGLIK